MGFGVEGRSEADERIRAAVRVGDRKQALRILMATYGTAIYGVCTRFLADRALTEDVHQTCFVQAYESLDTVLERGSVAAWLVTIARNRCLDALKIQRRRHRWQVLHGSLPEVHDGRRSPEEELQRGALSQRLRHALDTLSSEARRAVELRFGEALSYEHMAELCGARAGTLQMRVSRALPALRRSLEAQGITRG
jgi:RNA polymerase sigma-70 factor (ECF subfamily)